MVEYRKAREADIEGQHAVFVAAEGELLARHGFAWPTTPPLEGYAPTYRHLLRHDGGRCFVAEADGRVVGYSGAFVRGAFWYLAALFIDPAHQGAGVGRRLIELALEGAPARRATISDSIQPVSNALYAKHGLIPTTPILGFRGRADLDHVRALAGEVVAAEVTSGALAELDMASYGFDRAVDHAYWATQAEPTLWLRDGRPAAYSYRWPTGRVGPLAGRDGAAAAAALAAELARGTEVAVNVPGSSASLVQMAVDSGLQLQAPAGLLLLSEGNKPPRSLAIASYGLF